MGRSLLAILALLILMPSVALAMSGTAPVPTVNTASLGQGNVDGDSLAVGNQDLSGVTLATALQNATGMPWQNNGYSGQTSTQIGMRIGGVPIQLTFTSNQFNSGLTGISQINGQTPLVYTSTMSPDPRWLSGPAAGTTYNAWGTVCGWHGLMAGKNGSSYTWLPDAANQGGNLALLGVIPQTCPANSIFTPDQAANLAQPTIIITGRNDTNSPSQIASDDALIMAALKSVNYLALSVPNAEYEPSGSGAYNAIASINAAKAAAWGSHYFDWRAYAVSLADLSDPMDTLDHTNDIPPFSLRAIINRGTVPTLTNSTCNFTLPAPTVGGAYTANEVIKVDSEYILLTTVTGNVVTACTRGYGTGGVAASHTAGTAVIGVDPLHLSGSFDQLVVNHIMATPALKAALLGSVQTQVPTGAAIGAQQQAPQLFQGAIKVNGLVQADGGVVIPGGGCLYSYDNSGGPYSGNLYGAFCTGGGTGVISVGGAYNTKVCLTVGGGASCEAGLENGSGLLFDNQGIADLGYTYNTTATSGSTVIMADTKDTLDLAVGALAALTVQLPTCSTSYDGKVVHIDTTGTITTMTLTTTAGTVGTNANPGTLPRSTAVKCNGALATWFAY